MREIAEAVLAADWGESSRSAPSARGLLLDGIAAVRSHGYAAGARTLKGALRAFHDEPMSDEDACDGFRLACRSALATGDEVSWDGSPYVRWASPVTPGDLSLLPIVLAERFSVQLFLGDLVAAEAGHRDRGRR